MKREEGEGGGEGRRVWGTRRGEKGGIPLQNSSVVERERRVSGDGSHSQNVRGLG